MPQQLLKAKDSPVKNLTDPGEYSIFRTDLETFVKDERIYFVFLNVVFYFVLFCICYRHFEVMNLIIDFILQYPKSTKCFIQMTVDVDLSV